MSRGNPIDHRFDARNQSIYAEKPSRDGRRIFSFLSSFIEQNIMRSVLNHISLIYSPIKQN